MLTRDDSGFALNSILVRHVAGGDASDYGFKVLVVCFGCFFTNIIQLRITDSFSEAAVAKNRSILKPSAELSSSTCDRRYSGILMVIVLMRSK